MGTLKKIYGNIYEGEKSGAVLYSYDIHGNVKTLMQDNKQLEDGSRESAVKSQRFKRIDYEYDLISGKVNAVHYQDGQPDAFHHKYEYDADNRLTNVWTSSVPRAQTRYCHDSSSCPLPSCLWDQDAKYFYYKHGPLARTELGDLKVQGIDYAYTLQGWLKGVNSETGAMSRDMGRDGLSGTVNGGFANDAYGYSLTYYDGDYKPIGVTGTQNNFIANKTNSDLLNSRNDLFNGNISAMVTTITEPSTGISKPQGTAYKYDQLNRLVEMKAYQNVDVATNKWGSGTAYNGMYHNTFTYDGNGNIVTQTRNDENGDPMDALVYRYHDLGGKRIRNRLYHVNDSVTTAMTDDLEDQGVFISEPEKIDTANNYSYDEIGNLIRDKSEEIENISWTASGKVSTISRTYGSQKKRLRFMYDGFGNRIAKHVYAGNGDLEIATDYVRDASGNIMSVYEYKSDSVTQKVSYAQVEKHIYGSSRLGVDRSQVELIGAVALDTARFIHRLGLKSYELVNHLGNVGVVVSDRKLPVYSGGVFEHWKAEVLSATDYYPFGMMMPNRGSAYDKKYRFGFNGMEKDDEMKSTGNHYSFSDYGYDPRTNRRWNIDPLSDKLPGWSPYAFCVDNPIMMIDPDGQIPFPVNAKYKGQGFRISSWFGPRNTGLSYASKSHKGLDINFGSGKFDYGAPVLSTHTGVASVDNDPSGKSGRSLTVTSPDGSFRTKFFHLKKINVKEGDKIREASQIGEIGGSAMGKELGGQVHLHYQIETYDVEKKTWNPYNPTEGKSNSKENIVDPQKWNYHSIQKLKVEDIDFSMSRDNTKVEAHLHKEK